MSETMWVEVGARAEKITWAGENAGDFITGVVEDFKEVTRKDGSKGNVLTLTDEDAGVTYNVWAKSMLLRLLNDADIQPGQLIKIEYHGMQPLKTDKTKKFRSYKLFVAATV